jgi:hypothetical protein
LKKSVPHFQIDQILLKETAFNNVAMLADQKLVHKSKPLMSFEPKIKLEKE